MKFKVGDKVKVVKCNIHSNCENINKISKIIKIENFVMYPYYLEDCVEPFKSEELELVKKQFTKADLKDGDIVTYRNGSKRTVIAKKLINSGGYIAKNIDNYTEELKDTISGIDLDIVKVERPIQYETMFERKEEILDETEKRYLANIIRPFRGKVETIKKVAGNKEYISIELKDEASIDFPYFKEDTMYKGMTKDKEYTLKELGL